MRDRIVCVTALFALALNSALNAEDRLTVKLWPGTAPGETGEIGAESSVVRETGKRILITSNVSEPTLTVYPAPEDKQTGTAVVVCPGGGYNILAWDLEGTEVCEWLNSIGVTGLLLKYRVPRRAGRDKQDAPLQDSQRALSLARANAAEWKINPERIGILGFSAGGHLSATTATGFDKRNYEAIDDADKASCRPDFAVLVYPAYLVEGDAMSPEIRVTEHTPPVFFAHANDDPISPENSARMFLALKKVNVLSELHIYNGGGHGFGLRPSGHACSKWPAQCEQWFRSMKYIP